MPRRSSGRSRYSITRRRSYGWLAGPLLLGALLLAHLITQKNPPHNTSYKPANAYSRPDITHSATDELTGLARISDGDTIRIGQTRIRFYGIDAPEKAQRCTDADGRAFACGMTAKQALETHVQNRQVNCTPHDTDRYGRTVAVCYLDGEDLNDWMVRQGWAVAYRQYGTDYAAAEDEAREHRRGIWAGRFEMPNEWRRAHRH